MSILESMNMGLRIEKALEKADISFVRKYAETGTIYLEGEHNGVSFKIRISDHFVLYPCRFTVFIDTFEDELTPAQIVNEIKKGKASSYWVGREWVEEQEKQNKMWRDEEQVIRNKERFERYIKLWEDAALVEKIQSLQNKPAIKEFARANGLSCIDVLAINKGIKRFYKYVNLNF